MIPSEILGDSNLIYTQYLSCRRFDKKRQLEKMTAIVSSVNNLFDKIMEMFRTILTINPSSPIENKPIWNKFSSEVKQVPFDPVTPNWRFDRYLNTYKSRILYFLEMAEFFQKEDSNAVVPTDKYPEFALQKNNERAMLILPPYGAGKDCVNFAVGKVPLETMYKFAKEIKELTLVFYNAHMIDDTDYRATAEKIIQNVMPPGIKTGRVGNRTVTQAIMTLCKSLFDYYVRIIEPDNMQLAASATAVGDDIKASAKTPEGSKDAKEAALSIGNSLVENAIPSGVSESDKKKINKVKKLVKVQLSKLQQAEMKPQ